MLTDNEYRAVSYTLIIMVVWMLTGFSWPGLIGVSLGVLIGHYLWKWLRNL